MDRNATSRRRKRVVFKLSGSLFTLRPDIEKLNEFAELFKRLSKNIQPILVAGGGRLARDYIHAARKFRANEADLDDLGINASRLNAWLIKLILGDASGHRIPRSLEEVASDVNSGLIVVAGGLHPGQSTNAVSALIAEKVGAKLFVNTTDVDGVYTGDPRKIKDARKLETITARQLRSIISGGEAKAGTYDLMDEVALNIIERSRIPTKIVRCSVSEIEKAVLGERVGSQVIT